MAGKRPDDHDSKKNRLRRSAALLLMDNRPGAASIPNICREAGLTPQTVHYYFDNRDNLIRDVVHGHMTRLLKRVEDDTPEDLPPLDRLYAMARAYAAVIEMRIPDHRTVLGHAQFLPKARHGDVRMMQRWLLHAVAGMVRDVAPHVPRERIMPLALSLLAMLNAHATWFKEGGGLRRAGYVDMVVRMVLSEASGAALGGEPAPASCAAD